MAGQGRQQGPGWISTCAEAPVLPAEPSEAQQGQARTEHRTQSCGAELQIKVSTKGSKASWMGVFHGMQGAPRCPCPSEGQKIPNSWG